ncbi:MAG: hypothetical protein FWD03_01515 [Defluviitaleaceae bacterium]|nr:hypothetical protein [Defluviitaleaceae bacterium]
MKRYNILLESLLPKNKMKIKFENDELHVPAEEANLGKSRHHVLVPGKFKLPFRIDMTVKLKFIRTNQIASQLRLYIGKGNVYFNGGHTSATDILTDTKSSVFGDNKLASAVYYNDIPSKEYVDISVIFGSNMMWAAVDGTYCYASDKLGYIELLRGNAMPEAFQDGMDMAICGGTDTKLTIKSFAVTEYENDEPEIPEAFLNIPELSSFEWFVKGLPPKVQDEIIKMDDFLLNDMKGSLKFRRAIDKHGHLTYKSPCGLSYEIREFGVGNYHGTHWVQSPTKPDYTNDAIAKLAKSSPDLAESIFNKLLECSPHTRECKRRTSAELNGQSKSICTGKIYFEMLPAEFEVLKKYIAAAGEVVKAAK